MEEESGTSRGGLRPVQGCVGEVQGKGESSPSAFIVLISHESSHESSRSPRRAFVGTPPSLTRRFFVSQENRRQAEEKDREELMQRVTTDDEFRLLVNQYDAEAGAKSTRKHTAHTNTPRNTSYFSFPVFVVPNQNSLSYDSP